MARPLALGPAVLDVDRLPSVPAVYLELKRLLASPKTTPPDIAQVVQRDPAIAAKLLQLVNSALFPHRSPVNDVDVAVARLGMSTVQAVTTCAAIFSATSARRLPRRPRARSSPSVAAKRSGVITTCSSRTSAT